MSFARQIVRDLVRIAPIVSILAAPAIALGQPELRRVLSRLLAPPTIQIEAGFKARLLVPPGLLYDPWGDPINYDPAGNMNYGARPDIWFDRNDQSTGNWDLPHPPPR